MNSLNKSILSMFALGIFWAYLCNVGKNIKDNINIKETLSVPYKWLCMLETLILHRPFRVKY